MAFKPYHPYYGPRTKTELIEWLHRDNMNKLPVDETYPSIPEQKSLRNGWRKLTKKQLYAIFFKRRREYDSQGRGQ